MILDRAFAKSLAESPNDPLVIGIIRDWLIERGAEDEADVLTMYRQLFCSWAASPEGSLANADYRQIIDARIEGCALDKLTAALQAEYREAALRIGRRYFAEHPGIARSKYAEVVFGHNNWEGRRYLQTKGRRRTLNWCNVVLEVVVENDRPIAVIYNSRLVQVARIKIRKKRPKGVAGGLEALPARV